MVGSNRNFNMALKSKHAHFKQKSDIFVRTVQNFLEAFASSLLNKGNKNPGYEMALTVGNQKTPK